MPTTQVEPSRVRLWLERKVRARVAANFTVAIMHVVLGAFLVIGTAWLLSTLLLAITAQAVDIARHDFGWMVRFQPSDTAGWLLGALMIVIALLGAVAHYALIKALDHAEASAVQPYAYTLLVWAAVLGLLVFGNMPDGWTIAGAAIVVLSGLYSWHHEATRPIVAAPQSPP